MSPSKKIYKKLILYFLKFWWKLNLDVLDAAETDRMFIVHLYMTPETLSPKLIHQFNIMMVFVFIENSSRTATAIITAIQQSHISKT